MGALVELPKIRYLISLLSLLSSWYGVMIFTDPGLQVLFPLVTWVFCPQFLSFTSPETLSFYNYHSFASHCSLLVFTGQRMLFFQSPVSFSGVSLNRCFVHGQIFLG